MTNTPNVDMNCNIIDTKAKSLKLGYDKIEIIKSKNDEVNVASK